MGTKFSQIAAAGSPQTLGDTLIGVRGGTTDVQFTVGVPNASGSIATTTGTITSGHNSLVVASATGWSVGMGIAVANAGPGGNTELITYITNIAGTTFTLNDNASANATGQTVNHDDTRAISAAITSALASNGTVYLPSGNYNITSQFPMISAAIQFFGDGLYITTIYNRGKTNDIFQILPVSVNINGGHYHDFSIQQASGITPTAGYGFNCGGGGSIFLFGCAIERVSVSQTWAGLFIGSGCLQNEFSTIIVFQCIGGWGITYNCPPSAGDNNICDCWVQGSTCGVQIIASDTTLWDNLKCNGKGIVFAGSTNTDIGRVRFMNPSIEGPGSSGTGVDFGANGATSISIIGGEIAGWQTNVANKANVNGLTMVGVLYYSATSQDPFYYGVRGQIEGNTTFYVGTTGSDSTGDGSSSLPWRTILFAWNQICSKDLNGFTVTLQIGDGNYSDSIIIGGAAATTNSIPVGGGLIVIQGNTGDNTKVVWNSGSATLFAVNTSFGTPVKFFSFTAKNTITGSNAHPLFTNTANCSFIFTSMIWGGADQAYLQAIGACSHTVDFGTTTFSGTCGSYYGPIVAESGALVTILGNVLATAAISWGAGTLAGGTPGFVNSAYGASILINSASTFTTSGAGSYTGPKYLSAFGGTIETFTANVNFLPGSIAGSSATGYYD